MTSSKGQIHSQQIVMEQRQFQSCKVRLWESMDIYEINYSLLGVLFFCVCVYIYKELLVFVSYDNESNQHICLIILANISSYWEMSFCFQLNVYMMVSAQIVIHDLIRWLCISIVEDREG